MKPIDINHAVESLQDQPWINATSSTVQKAMGKAVDSGGDPAKKVKNFLNGTWIGHPLHPILTDVAIGGYNVAFLLDVVGELSDKDALRTGADQALAVGLLGSLASAVSGAADWSDTDGKARNIGLLHALLNISATTLYASAFAVRKRNRPLRFWLSMAGAAVVTAGAYLGGHLVYEEQIGVDHTKGEPFPEKFTPVMPVSDLREAIPVRKDVNGARVLLVKQEGRIYAISEVCSHLGGPLAEGEYDAESATITCPWHGSEFCVKDGSIVNGPTSHPAPCFRTRIRNGQVEVKLEAHT